MNSNLKRLGPILSYLIAGLGIIGFIVVMSTGISKEDVELMTLNAEDGAENAVGRFTGAVNFFMGLTISAIALAAGLILFFVGRTAAQDGKKLVKPLIFSGAIAAIFGFGFLLPLAVNPTI